MPSRILVEPTFNRFLEASAASVPGELFRSPSPMRLVTLPNPRDADTPTTLGDQWGDQRHGHGVFLRDDACEWVHKPSSLHSDSVAARKLFASVLSEKYVYKVAATLPRIRSASAVQTKGLGFSLRWSK